MESFSWILPGRLAGMACPGLSRPLAADLQTLHALGIRVVVSLTEAPLDRAELERLGMRGLHFPVPDYDAPSLEVLDRLVDAVDRSLAEGAGVAIHCAAGLGRTGTALGAVLIHFGHAADEAMAEVRRCRPGSIETSTQVTALQRFAGARIERARSAQPSARR